MTLLQVVVISLFALGISGALIAAFISGERRMKDTERRDQER